MCDKIINLFLFFCLLFNTHHYINELIKNYFTISLKTIEIIILFSWTLSSVNLASIEVTVNSEHSWSLKRNAVDTSLGYFGKSITYKNF